jgi:hypothetical protein
MRTVTSFTRKCVCLVGVAVWQVAGSTSPCKAPQDLRREVSLNRYWARTTLDHDDRESSCIILGPLLWSSGQSSWLHNGDVLCFLWTPNWMYICYVEDSRPPLWSSGQSSWLQIQRSKFDSPRYQIFWEVVGLKRCPLSLVSATEELLGRKSSGSALENREYGRRDPSLWPRDTLYPQKFALTSPTSGCRSVGIVRSRSQATEFSFSFLVLFYGKVAIVAGREGL